MSSVATPLYSIKQDLLDEVVRRIVRTSSPQRIILFGSAARGTLGPNSDLDIMVVMPDGSHRRHTAARIFRSLRGIGIPKDIIVVTDADIRTHRDNPALMLKPALEEGMELYVSTPG